MMTDEELAAIHGRIRKTGDELYRALGNPSPHIPSVMQLGLEDAPALLAEVERLRERDAAMREIVQAVGRGDMICAQEDFGTTPICVFGCEGHEDENEIGAFIHTSTCPAMKARALLATPEGERDDERE